MTKKNDPFRWVVKPEKGYIMESTVYEIEFIYKGLPYRRLRSTEKEVDKVIKDVTLHGGVVTKIIKW